MGLVFDWMKYEEAREKKWKPCTWLEKEVSSLLQILLLKDFDLLLWIVAWLGKVKFILKIWHWSSKVWSITRTVEFLNWPYKNQWSLVLHHAVICTMSHAKIRIDFMSGLADAHSTNSSRPLSLWTNNNVFSIFLPLYKKFTNFLEQEWFQKTDI